tara:strand:+ start:3351 stop:3863 length:513 start_codon:yes stop_codon:yes gene_type:complete
MFQFVVSELVVVSQLFNTQYVCLMDKMTSTDYLPLVRVVSQATGAEKVYKPNTSLMGQPTINERYYTINTVLLDTGDSATGTTEDLAAGLVRFEINSKFPLGLYDLYIYENTEDSNTSLKVSEAMQPPLYKGVVNVTNNEFYQNVHYLEYDKNDSKVDFNYQTYDFYEED